MRGHAFVLEVSNQVSERSCICVRGIKPGKSEIMYVLEVPSQVSERSCICVRGIKPGKCEVMYGC